MKKFPIAIAMLACFGVAQADARPRSHDLEQKAAKGAKQVIIQSKLSPSNFTSTTFAQITASGSIVPAVTATGFLIATFTGEASCSGPSVNGWCSVRILCDGVEARPASGTDFAFRGVGSSPVWISATVTRHTLPFTGGSHSCEAQAAVVNGATGFGLDDWTFKVEFWRQ